MRDWLAIAFFLLVTLGMAIVILTVEWVSIGRATLSMIRLKQLMLRRSLFYMDETTMCPPCHIVPVPHHLLRFDADSSDDISKVFLGGR